MGVRKKLVFGTDNPGTTLDIQGTLRVADGTQGAGKCSHQMPTEQLHGPVTPIISVRFMAVALYFMYMITGSTV